MKKWFGAALAALLLALALPVAAQQVVQTVPSARTSNNASSTIAVTNTFQSLWASNSARGGCSIQNNGANSMWVFFGPIANASKATSVVLAANQSLACAQSGVSATDQVSITGTSGDAFFAVQDGAPLIGSSKSGGGGGTGTVTSVSVVSANGLAGTVATATTTPAITLSTSVTGALKGNGTAISQAACSDLSNGATGCSTAVGTSGATLGLLNTANTWSAVQTLPSPALTGTVTGNNTIPLGILAQSGANTMLGNWTGSTANVSANAMPSCADSAGNHLNYVSGTGVTCGTSDSHVGTVTSVGTTSPLGGGTITTSGTLTCTTCATTTNGGLLSATAPMTISAAGVIAATSSGSGSVCLTTSCVMITPTLGVASATSINFGAQALNKYAEGAFSCTIAFGGASVGVTYSNQSCNYREIGNFLFVYGRLTLTSKGSSTGLARIGGIPITFTVGTLQTSFTSNMATLTGNVSGDAYTTGADLYNGGASGSTTLTNANFTNTSDLAFSIVAYL